MAAGRDASDRRPASDGEVLARIKDLVEREQAMRDGHDGLDATHRAALHAMETELDQCWDLLRQRRGRRHGGGDPDDAQVRDEKTVEGYVQ